MRRNELQRGLVAHRIADIHGKELVLIFGIHHLDKDFAACRVDGGRGVESIIGLIPVHGFRHFEGAVAGHGEELLVIVVGRTPHAAVVKPDEVGVPLVEAFLAEERGVGSHHHHIGVALQASPVGRLRHGR